MGGKNSKQGEDSSSSSASASTAAAATAESKQAEPQAQPQAPLQVNSVQLNVYDPAAGSGGGMLSVGVHHSGLVLFDTEYTFAGSSEGGGGGSLTGIYSHRPHAVGDPQWAFREALNLGTTDLSREQVRTLLQQLKNSGEWTAGSYNLTKKNCNHFTETLAKLLGLSVPGWVNRSARVAGALGMGPSSSSSGPLDLDGRPLRESDRAALVMEAAPQDVCMDALLDLGAVGCLGHKSSQALRDILPVDSKGAGRLLPKTATLSSDADEQLLLFLPFVRAVKILSVMLRLGCKESELSANPRTIKFFVNQRSMDFSDVDSIVPTLVVELPLRPPAPTAGSASAAAASSSSAAATRPFTKEELKEGLYEVVVPLLPATKFANISFLTVLLESNHGATTTKLHGLTIIGREK